ncbi:polysaccharide deacetylase family protein [Autumnicola psychrophila]|uniref:Polysaccharide deacetylase family protein n=1 Tax=Autumnicola psychrophila TaxID=3075592 RepID=A0ABU3DUS1_9FLAO|nr:polysaccharide deacetylase family protein [Zunongwangia sp. F225]MDT0687224.1 polysaccharide deacetylase family protein [Zunongwangia sp. F225]
MPDRLVVLTFDDASSSHSKFFGLELKKYGFDATFFICEFPPDVDDKTKYMSWQQIRELDRQGFEIGNYTKDHIRVSKMTPEELQKQVEYVEKKCHEHKIPKPLSFAYPAWVTAPYAIEELKESGYRLARSGGNRLYYPQKDHPLLIPSYNAAGTDSSKVLDAIESAKDVGIVVLTFHGVPDNPHDWVTTPPDLFKFYLKYLYDHHYNVIAMEDLEEFIDIEEAMKLKPAFRNQD